jgi:hypothetical protein
MKKLFEHMDKSDIRNILAIISVLGVFTILTLLIFHPVPESNSRVIDMALGSVISVGFGVVMAYFFGSSKNEATAAAKKE